jgi:competence protein ComEC
VWHAGTSALLAGDAEEEAWNAMEAFYRDYLQSDFMRASHHGRDSGYHLDSLQRIKPRAVVVSVGRKPPTDASRKYCAQCKFVMSTRYYGNIELQIDDAGNHKWIAQRNAGKP